MATSGNIFIVASDLNLTLAWEVKSSDKEKMQTTIGWTLTATSAYGYYAGNIKAVLNDKTVYNESKTQKIPDFSENKKLASGNMTIAHSPDGTKVLTASLSADMGETANSLENQTASSFWLLPSLSNNATIYHAIKSFTETTLTIEWTSDATISALSYTLDNGTTWVSVGNPNKSKGTYTISGLTANHNYSVKSRVTKKGTSLTTISNVATHRTLAYPHCVKGNDFIIGGKNFLQLYNPLQRTVTIKFLYKGGSYFEKTVTPNSIPLDRDGNGEYFKLSTVTAMDALYASIPNQTSYRYDISVTYDGHTETFVEAGHYSINTTECKPAIGLVSYGDTNASTLAITHDSTLIIQNQSIVEYGADGLTAKKSATLKSCIVEIAGKTYNLSISGNYASGGNAVLKAGYNTDAKFTLTDSRGLTATKTLSVKVLAWSRPTALITLQRHDNYYTETDITARARYSSLNGENTITMSFKARKTGTSTWTIEQSLSDGATSSFFADNNYMWDVVVTVTDLFATTTYNLKLSRGTPIIYFDILKSSVGINCFPQNSESFEISGHDFRGDLWYKSGDTVTLKGFECAGHTGSSNKLLRFSMPMPKSLADVTPTVTTLKIVARHAGGGSTLDNSIVEHDVLNDATLTLTVSKPTGHDRMLQFDIEKTSAYNGSNNMPQAVWITECGLSFA